MCTEQKNNPKVSLQQICVDLIGVLSQAAVSPAYSETFLLLCQLLDLLPLRLPPQAAAALQRWQNLSVYASPCLHTQPSVRTPLQMSP